MSASLEKLVSNLPKESLRHTRKHLGDSELLYAKGVFPYEWFDSLTKFDCTELPPRDAFYSELNEEDITEEEYARAQTVLSTFHFRNFKDYHDLYLKMDVQMCSKISATSH